MEFLASILWVFLTIYIVLALLKINMYFKHIESSHNTHLIPDNKAKLSDFKLGKRLFPFRGCSQIMSAKNGGGGPDPPSLNVNKNKMFSPGLENNHTLKCCSGNFPPIYQLGLKLIYHISPKHINLLIL